MNFSIKKKISPDRTIYFYDKEQYPMLVGDVLALGRIFATAVIARGDKYIVGLFIEDDNNFHLCESFDRYWLGDLSNVATTTRSTTWTARSFQR